MQFLPGCSGWLLKTDWYSPLYMEGEIDKDGKFYLVGEPYGVDAKALFNNCYGTDFEMVWHRKRKPLGWGHLYKAVVPLLSPVWADDVIESIIHQGDEGYLDREGRFCLIAEEYGHTDAAKGIVLGMGLYDCNDHLKATQAENLLLYDEGWIQVRGVLTFNYVDIQPPSQKQKEVIEALLAWKDTSHVTDYYSDEDLPVFVQEAQRLLQWRW